MAPRGTPGESAVGWSAMVDSVIVPEEDLRFRVLTVEVVLLDEITLACFS